MKIIPENLTDHEFGDLCFLEGAANEGKIGDPCEEYAGYLPLMAMGLPFPHVAAHLEDCKACRYQYLLYKGGDHPTLPYGEEADGTTQNLAQVIPFPDRSDEDSVATDEDGDPDWEEMSILQAAADDGRAGRGGGTPSHIERRFKHGGHYWVFSAETRGNGYFAELQRPDDFSYVHTASLLTSDGEEIVVFAADETVKKIDSDAYAKFFQEGVRPRIDRS